MEKFVDDIIDHKEDDIEKIQTTPNMYISYKGRKGSLHLAKETFNNMVDECINPNSPGTDIDVYLDETENTISFSDNGRGLPFDKMEVVCTKLQSSSKFTREGTGNSAGQNGVGLTATNALSDIFEIISYRYGEKAIIRFEGGKLVQPLKISKSNGTKHGTTFKFKPSAFYLGDDCEIETDKLMEWVEKIVYLLPPDLRVSFSVNRKGKESSINKKYRNKNGLYDYVKKLCKKPVVDPIHFMKSTNATETDKGREFKRFIGLEVAFTYNSSSHTDLVMDSFCNFINTVDNGVHADATKTGIVHYLTRKTREGLSEREAKNLDIQNRDAESGLIVSVYLSTDMHPQFSGQTKEKMTSSEFFSPIRTMTFQALDEYFKLNPKELKRLTDHIKTAAKVRIAATKVRNSVVRGETSSLDEHKMKNFTPANNRGKNDYREVFIIEGDSAAGSARQDRFSNDTQALFAMRGVPLNSFGLKLDKVLLNEEFKKLVKVLGCNIGEKFDITKLKYKKIIIMTDSDVDGYRISSLLCVFFLMHMPEIVKEGFLYKAVAPLYRIKDKKSPFIRNRQEYIHVFEERIGDNIRLINPDTNVVMKAKTLQEFLMMNRDYLEELRRTSNHFAIHHHIIEFVAIHGEEKDFVKKLTKKFPEITIDKDNVLSGIYEGQYQIVNMDKLFHKRLTSLRYLIHEVNHGQAYYLVHQKNGKGYMDKGVMSIGDLLAECEKFQPVIETRFKGLGELNPKELKETTLNPNNRILIQLTLQDIKQEIEKFRVLHGDSSEERKQLMEHFKINRDDLDN